MEYILLGIFTFISLLTGFIVGIIWLIRERNKFIKKWFRGFIYIFISIFISSFIIQMIAILFWIIESENNSFDIHKFLATSYNTIRPWGLMSGFTSIFVFVIGIIIYGISKLFKDS